jgi:hypothetical protein
MGRISVAILFICAAIECIETTHTVTATAEKKVSLLYA